MFRWPIGLPKGGKRMIEKFRRKQERLNELLEWLDGERLKHISTFGQEPETLFGKELSKYTIDELIEKYRKDKRKPNGGGVK